MKISAAPPVIISLLLLGTLLISCGENGSTSSIDGYPTTLLPASLEEKTEVLSSEPDGHGGWTVPRPPRSYSSIMFETLMMHLAPFRPSISDGTPDLAFRFTSDSTVQFISWYNSSNWDLIDTYSYIRSGSSYILVNESDTIYGRERGEDFHVYWTGVSLTYGDSTGRSGGKGSGIISIPSAEFDLTRINPFLHTEQKPLLEAQYQVAEVIYSR